MPPIVNTEGLTKRYGDITALDECTLSAQPGEVLGLLGPNGSGKTTLLRLLLGFLKPTSGCATILEHDCTNDSVAVRRCVTYLPGEPRLPRRMRGSVALRYFAKLRGESSSDAGNRIAERLRLDVHRRVGNMSTGMRQKLALAIALAPDVPLVILDEPTSNLDPNVRDDVGRLVAEARDAGKAVVFSSHVMPEVEAVCDRVVILRHGKLVHTQVMSELRRQHRIRADVVGELSDPPAALDGGLSIQSEGNQLRIDTPGELSPLLKWLAEQPLKEVTVEPLGLRSVYEQYHQ